MELTQLTYFLTVAQMQHMTRAAEALHIAQPALTKSVQRLESELGVPLIARKGRGIALTPYGQRLADELQQPLNQLSHIPEVMRQMANQQARTLHVCVLAASDLVTDAAVRFRQTHPDVHFAMTLLPRISDAAHPPYDLLVDSDGMNGDDGAAVLPARSANLPAPERPARAGVHQRDGQPPFPGAVQPALPAEWIHAAVCLRVHRAVDRPQPDFARLRRWVLAGIHMGRAGRRHQATTH